MKGDRRRAQIKNIATTVLPESHRTNDTVVAFSLGFAQGLAVARYAPMLAQAVVSDLGNTGQTGEDAAFAGRTQAIVALLMEK